MGKAFLSKEHRKLRQLMQRRGFAWTDQTSAGHGKIQILCPNGQRFVWVIPSTPSDRRSWKNQTCELRRLLAQAGYPDERAFLKVGTHKSTPVPQNEIYDWLDVLDEGSLLP